MKGQENEPRIKRIIDWISDIIVKSTVEFFQQGANDPGNQHRDLGNVIVDNLKLHEDELEKFRQDLDPGYKAFIEKIAGLSKSTRDDEEQ